MWARLCVVPVLCLGCGGSQTRPILPQDLAGLYQWQIVATATSGLLRIHGDVETVVPDTLWIGSDAVFECTSTDGCALACGPFCFRARSQRLHGVVRECAEHMVPVTRSVRDPRTGEVTRQTELERREECREVPVFVEAVSP